MQHTSNKCRLRPRRSSSSSATRTLLSFILISSSTIIIAQLASANQLVSMPYHHQVYQQQSSVAQLAPNRNGGNGDQLGGNSNQMIPAASSQSSSALTAPLFKDLSGPTSGKIQTLDVICGKHFMTVRAEFSGPFYGIVFSKGTYGQDNCIYVKPNSGLTHAAFNVYYDQCGTKPELQKKFYENTIVIQYGSDIIEAYDEAKRLRCEWFEAYEKPATFKPAIPVADLEVVEMNFQGDDIDCWMEIQEGTGPSSREVSKIVPVGQPMTIVVAINDYNGQFDMRVKSCVAHDGQQQPIALTDEFGCVLRPKMLTAFQKVRNPGGIHKRATILSYSRFLAFKFPDSTTVQIQCTVEVCRHGCADACQRIPSIAATTLQPELSLSAKWPANSNQPSIGDMTNINRAALNRPQQFQPDIGPSSAEAGAGGGQPPSSQPSNDDMSGSESSQEPAVMVAASTSSSPNSATVAPSREVRQDQLQHHHYHHHHHHHHNNNINNPTRLDPRIPHYSNPPSSNHRRQPQMPLHGARLPSSLLGVQTIPQTTTTAATTTTSTTTTTSQPNGMSSESQSQPAGDEISSSASESQPQVDQQPSDSSRDDSQANKSEQSGSQSSSDQAASESQPAAGPVEQDQANQAVSSAVENQNKASESAPGQKSQSQGDIQNTSDQSAASSIADSPRPVETMTAESSEVKPSVQGDDDQQPQPVKRDEPVRGSSLSKVEVEIPANESPNQNAFSSVRLSSTSSQSNTGELINSPASYDSIMFENSRYQDQDQSQNRDPTSGGLIQPRESSASNKQQAVRDKQHEDETVADEGQLNYEAAAAATSQFIGAGSGKMRFGARSQPQQSQQQQQQVATGPISSSSSSSSSETARTGQLETSSAAAASNHRSSGESSSLIDSASSKSGDGASSSSVEINPDKILLDRSDDSASLSDVVNLAQPKSPSSEVSNDESSSSSSSSSSSKIMPVVGTDELATGPVQIEDRIGVPAPSSKQQESLEEALTRLQQQIPQTAALISSSSSSQPQSVDSTDSKTSDHTAQSQLASESLNGGESLARADRTKEQRSGNAAAAQHKADSSSQLANQQPHPNVAGQAKVIPEPSGGLSPRGTPIQSQASSIENVYAIPVNGMQQPQQPSASQMQPNLSYLQQQAAGMRVQSMQQQQQQLPVAGQQQMIDTFKQQQSQPVAQITNVPIGINFAQSQIPAVQQIQQQLAQQFQQQQLQTTPKPTRGRFNLLSPQAAFQAVASRLLPKSSQQAQRLPQVEQRQKTLLSQQQVANQFMIQKQQPQPVNQPVAQSKAAGLFSRLTSGLHSQQQQQQQPLTRTRRSALMPNADNKGEIGLKRTFIVVTGMDLAFSPGQLQASDLPEILNGHRLGQLKSPVKAKQVSSEVAVEDDGVIYGVCMPIVSLTFVLTCAFWLIVFLLTFCIYLFIKSRRQQQRDEAFESGHGAGKQRLVDSMSQSSILTR